MCIQIECVFFYKEVFMKLFNFLRFFLVINAFLLSINVFAQESNQPAEDEGINLAFGGDLYLSIQNWPDIGMSDDQKYAFGVGASLGIGIEIDNMKFLIGPHFAMSRWEADYSQKPYSYTDSVYVRMDDVGLQATMEFDNIYINFGKGFSTIITGMILKTGEDVEYPINGDSYSYNEVLIGYHFNIFAVGIGFVSYEGVADSCNRGEIQLGLRY